jgi:hypothetical protein
MGRCDRLEFAVATDAREELGDELVNWKILPLLLLLLLLLACVVARSETTSLESLESESDRLRNRFWNIARAHTW